MLEAIVETLIKEKALVSIKFSDNTNRKEFEFKRIYKTEKEDGWYFVENESDSLVETIKFRPNRIRKIHIIPSENNVPDHAVIRLRKRIVLEKKPMEVPQIEERVSLCKDCSNKNLGCDTEGPEGKGVFECSNYAVREKKRLKRKRILAEQLSNK